MSLSTVQGLLKHFSYHQLSYQSVILTKGGNNTLQNGLLLLSGYRSVKLRTTCSPGLTLCLMLVCSVLSFVITQSFVLC